MQGQSLTLELLHTLVQPKKKQKQNTFMDGEHYRPWRAQEKTIIE